MSDLCECVCEYIWAMGRVLTAMQTQTQCTDTECFTERSLTCVGNDYDPGYEPGAGDTSSGGMVQTVLFVLIWMVIAIVLFLLRPSSLRGSTNGKPALRDNEDERPPPGGEVQ